MNTLVEGDGNLLHRVEGGALCRCCGVVLQKVYALTDLSHLLRHTHDVTFTLWTHHGSQYRTIGRAGPHGTCILQTCGLIEIDSIPLVKDKTEGIPYVVVHHLPLTQGSAGGRGGIHVAVIIHMSGIHILIFQSREVMIGLGFGIEAYHIDLIVGVAYRGCHIFAVGTDDRAHLHHKEFLG